MIGDFSMNMYVLKKIGYIMKLEQLGFIMNHKLSIDLVLRSKPWNFLAVLM